MTTERAPPTGVALAEAQPRRRRGSHVAPAAAACCRALNCWPRIDGTFWYHRLFALLQG
jgi:hypothetical protein